MLIKLNIFSNTDYFAGNHYFEDIDQEAIFDNFIVDISLPTIIYIYLVPFWIILISSIVPSIIIMLYDPNKILAHKD